MQNATTQLPNQLNYYENNDLNYSHSNNHHGYIIDKNLIQKKREEKIIRIEDFEPFITNGLSNYIGKGAFSEVVLVRHKRTKIKYALKIINKIKFNSEKQQENFRKEIDIHERLIHPNIIRLYGSIEDESNIYLVLEYEIGRAHV